MITPSPTTKIAPTLARGILAAVNAATATRPATISLELPNTSYRLHLVPAGEVHAPVGKRLVGTIGVKARRIDTVGSGGRYVEPVIGPPQRVQGSVIAVTEDAVVVHAGVPIHATPTDPRQKPSDFMPGQFVSFDAMEGATFTPEE